MQTYLEWIFNFILLAKISSYLEIYGEILYTLIQKTSSFEFKYVINFIESLALAWKVITFLF